MNDASALPPVENTSVSQVLTPDEAKELGICEGLISRGLETFVEVGLALTAIREKRLYRAEFETFDVYCQAKWGMRARSARRMCDAAAIAVNISTPPDHNGSNWTHSALAVPATESQIRPLVKLPPEEQRSAWAEAVATAPHGVPTGAHVASVVAARRVALGLDQPPSVSTLPPSAEPQPPVFKFTPSEAPSPHIPQSIWTGPTDRQENVRAVVDRAINDVRELVTLIGTADSEAAGAVNVALAKLDEYRDHLEKVARLQASARRHD